MKRKKNLKSHTRIVFICETEQDRSEGLVREEAGSPVHASPSFVLGCQGLSADLFRFVVVLLWGFWIRLHVSTVEAEKRERDRERTMRCVLLKQVSIGRALSNRLICRNSQ